MTFQRRQDAELGDLESADASLDDLLAVYGRVSVDELACSDRLPPGARREYAQRFRTGERTAPPGLFTGGGGTGPPG